jgi:hypothetical protein
MPLSAPKSGHLISKFAKLCGITPKKAQDWQVRYNWPRPLPNQHVTKDPRVRIYSDASLKEAQYVAKMLDKGYRITDLVDRTTGLLRPDPLRRIPTIGDCLRKISKPETSDGKAIRAKLVELLEAKDVGAILECVASAGNALRPAERASAVFLPVLCWLATCSGVTAARRSRVERQLDLVCSNITALRGIVTKVKDAVR